MPSVEYTIGAAAAIGAGTTPGGCYNRAAMSLLERVAETISRGQLLRPGQPVLAAVSGGPDSLCMVHILLELDYRPHLAHLDHALRPESPKEAEFIRSLAERWDLPIRLERAEGSGWEEAGSLEEAARLARYRFLVRAAREAGVEAIVTGHTFDDQVETILMHLLRGAGPEGLAGIRPRQAMGGWQGIGGAAGLALVRPLLEVRGEETEAYCQEQGLRPVRDPTNRDLRFFRNRLRHELLPILREYNPKVDEVLGRTGEIMGAVADWLEAEVERHWRQLARRAGEDAVALKWDAVGELPLALRREVIRRAIRELLPDPQRLDFEATQRALRYLESDGSGLCTLLSGLRMERAGEEALVLGSNVIPEFPQVPQLADESPLPVSGKVQLAAGWELLCRPVEGADGLRENLLRGKELYEGDRLEVLDLAATEGELRLRSPKVRDRFQPLGMSGSMPLSDFFVNEKIPRLQRARWPLVVDEGRIVWVVGLRLSQAVRVKPGSRQLLHLRLLAPED